MGGVLIEVDSTVGELSERSLLLDLGGLNGVLFEEKMSAFALEGLEGTLAQRASASCRREKRSIGTHVFVSHVCGWCECRLSMLVESRKLLLAIVG